MENKEKKTIGVTNTAENSVVSDNFKEATQEYEKIAVENNLPIDIISISIKQSLEELGKITGQNVSEDIINEIFSKFREKETVPLEAISFEEGKEDKYENVDLQKAIDSLEKEDRIVIVLRYYEDMKLEDIAVILDENLSTVKSRLYRSMKKLKLQLEPYDENA